MSLALPAEERRLTSWKEIAAYFGNDQRTVKRWESTRGLPVRRLPGARSGVFALVSEIEAWQRGEAVPVRSSEASATPGDFPEEGGSEAAGLLDSARSTHAFPPASPPAEAIVREDAQAPDAPDTSTPGPMIAAGQQTPAARRKPHLSFFWQAVFTAVGIAVVCSIALWQHEVHGAVKWVYQPQPRAKELYLQGRFLWNKRTPESLRAALADFEEAAKIDPQYAAAYAGIADCFALAPQFDPRPGSEVYPRMLAASQKALALDASSPEGHRALAFAQYYWNFDIRTSRAEFIEAVRLAPHDATTHLWFANTLATSGLYREALNEVEQAREIDPTSPSIMADRAWILYQAGRRDDAFQIWKRLEDTDPDYTMVHTWLARFYLDAHRTGEFLEELASISRLTGRPYDAGRLSAAQAGLKAAREQGMKDTLADFEEDAYRRGTTSAYSVAEAMLRAGRDEMALDYLERSYRNRDQFVPGLGQTELFRSLHTAPKFQELAAASDRPYRDGPLPQALLHFPIAWK